MSYRKETLSVHSIKERPWHRRLLKLRGLRFRGLLWWQSRWLGEDYPGPSGFNVVVGEHLGILVRMRLTPSASVATGN